MAAEKRLTRMIIITRVALLIALVALALWYHDRRACSVAERQVATCRAVLRVLLTGDPQGVNPGACLDPRH